MVIYRRWEKTWLLESLISVWEFLFSDSVEVVAILLL